MYRVAIEAEALRAKKGHATIYQNSWVSLLLHLLREDQLGSPPQGSVSIVMDSYDSESR